MKSNITALKKAIEIAGAQTHLAKAIGCNQQNISLWLKTGKISPSKVIAIEKVTGVSRHTLRPDIYPPEDKAA